MLGLMLKRIWFRLMGYREWTAEHGAYRWKRYDFARDVWETKPMTDDEMAETHAHWSIK
jgi:hypothetical protein